MPTWVIRLAASWLILVATLLTYLPALKAGFVFDDEQFLTDNPLIKARDGLYRFWFTIQPLDYFPLTSTMLWFEWRLWGMTPTGYHVVNVLLHAAGAVLLWRVLRQLGIPGAWLAALIFAVHPVNVESVAWITERKNVLPMVFQMLTLLFYLRFLREGGSRWYALSIGSFALALLAKTSVVMLPVVLLLCVWWLRGRVSLKDVRDGVPFFVLSGVLALVTLWFHSHRAIGSMVVRDDGFLSRLVGAAWAIGFYLYKAILPYPLCVVYPRWTIPLSNPLSYVPLVLSVSCFAVLWRYRAGWARPACLALGYYVVMLFPVLGFFNISFMYYSLVADRWQYVSLPGIIALVTGLCAHAYRRWPMIPRGGWWSVGAGVVGALSVLTWHQAGIYKDEETLWRGVLAKNPECFLAHSNLGAFLEKEGNHNEALTHFHEAIRIKPDFADAHRNLGTALIAQRDLDQAVLHLKEALRLEPNDARTCNNLGVALAEIGRTDEALAHFQKAVDLNPNAQGAWRNLAWLLATSHDETYRDGTKAVHVAQRACTLTRYERPDVLDTLAAAYAEAGRFDEARAWARKAIDLASRLGDHDLAGQIQGRLRLYESSRAFHEAPKRRN